MRFLVKIWLSMGFYPKIVQKCLKIIPFLMGRVVKNIRKQTPITDVCFLYAISRQN
jgi:hypothetical protein